jgi:hypothetical protein
MYAVIVDNYQANVATLVNGTIYDDEETARSIAFNINQTAPPHVAAWIHDFKGAAPIANIETDGIIDAERLEKLAEEE